MRPAVSFVQQPVRSLQTMLRVIAEDDSRMPDVVPDGIYGPATMNAVTAFQRREGIPVTGITDEYTWTKIVNAYEPALIRISKAEPIEIIMNPGEVYRLGDANSNIYLLQAILTELSNKNSSISKPSFTGILDNDTADSITGFQRLSGLPTTGELDKITWKHLSKQFTLSSQQQTVKDEYL